MMMTDVALPMQNWFLTFKHTYKYSNANKQKNYILSFKSRTNSFNCFDQKIKNKTITYTENSPASNILNIFEIFGMLTINSIK